MVAILNPGPTGTVFATIDDLLWSVLNGLLKPHLNSQAFLETCTPRLEFRYAFVLVCSVSHCALFYIIHSFICFFWGL